MKTKFNFKGKIQNGSKVITFTRNRKDFHDKSDLEDQAPKPLDDQLPVNLKQVNLKFKANILEV